VSRTLKQNEEESLGGEAQPMTFCLGELDKGNIPSGTRTLDNLELHHAAVKDPRTSGEEEILSIYIVS